MFNSKGKFQPDLQTKESPVASEEQVVDEKFRQTT